MSDSTQTQPTSARVAMSNAMVRLHKEQFGRGPTLVRSHFAGPDALLCVLEEVLLPAELKLIELGEDGLVAGVLASPWLFTCIIASVIAFYASARGLQKGEAVPVITLTSAAANVTAISGGIIVFGDPMPSDPVGIVVQSFAFVLVIVAAALTPAPLRAARAAA